MVMDIVMCHRVASSYVSVSTQVTALSGRGEERFEICTCIGTHLFVPTANETHGTMNETGHTFYMNWADVFRQP